MQKRPTKATFLLALLVAVVLAVIWRQPGRQYSPPPKELVLRDDDTRETFVEYLQVAQNQSDYLHHSQKRADNPNALLKQCHDRGCGLNQLLQQNTIAGNKQTAYTQFKQIRQNGWVSSTAETNDDEFSSVAGALQAYNLPGQNDASWSKINWLHSQSTTINGKTYPRTEGYFNNVYNPAHGTIMAVENSSPKNNDVDVPADEVIPLSNWSDVVFLTWMNLCTGQAQMEGMKYIMQVNIISDDTNEVIGQMLPSKDLDDLPGYPGVTFDTSSYQGTTLLGTPNGNGVGWFLAQHKDKLGATRQVTKIQVWNSASDEEDQAFLGTIPCMLFEISDPE